MAVRFKYCTIYDVYDRQNQLVFTGTVRQIAEYFNLSENSVHNCFERHGRMLWEYKIVSTNKKDGKDVTYTHDIYKVIDDKGNVIFRGSVRQIANWFFVTTGTVYKVAQGKSKRLLGLYTLEYDGKEVLVKDAGKKS